MNQLKVSKLKKTLPKLKKLTAKNASRSKISKDAQMISFYKIFPSIVTLLALCAGVTSIRFALNGNFEYALIAILIAGFFDLMDGKIARFLGAQSKFGAELDSLADLVSFGVAPGLIIYLWKLHELGSQGWAIFLIYIICNVLRLARFNSKLDEKQPAWMIHFFTGMPVPAAASCILLPLALSFLFPESLISNPYFLSVWSILISLYMISRLPTFALKGVKIKQKYFMPLMLFIAFIAYALVHHTWSITSLIIAIYILSLPFASIRFIHYRKKFEADPLSEKFHYDFS